MADFGWGCDASHTIGAYPTFPPPTFVGDPRGKDFKLRSTTKVLLLPPAVKCSNPPHSKGALAPGKADKSFRKNFGSTDSENQCRKEGLLYHKLRCWGESVGTAK
jgi:hypothetical protein